MASQVDYETAVGELLAAQQNALHKNNAVISWPGRDCHVYARPTMDGDWEYDVWSWGVKRAPQRAATLDDAMAATR